MDKSERETATCIYTLRLHGFVDSLVRCAENENSRTSKCVNYCERSHVKFQVAVLASTTTSANTTTRYLPKPACDSSKVSLQAQLTKAKSKAGGVTRHFKTTGCVFYGIWCLARLQGKPKQCTCSQGSSKFGDNPKLA